MLEDLKNAILDLNLNDNKSLFNGDDVVILSKNVMYHICGDKVKRIDIVDNEKYESKHYSYLFMNALQWNQIDELYATSDACITITGIEYPMSVEKNGIFINDLEDETRILILALDKEPLKATNFTIGPQSFRYAKNMSSIVVSSDNIQFDIQAFSGISPLKSIDLSKTSLSSISQEMFEEDVNLKNVVLPSSVTSIGVGAFLGCTSLKSIEIPSSVTNLEYKCFKDCINMISIEIPCNVSAYGGHVFENCRSLSTIICHSSTPLNICEYQMNDSLSIFVDENKIQSYINDLNNNKYNHLSSNLLKTTYVK